MVRQKTAIELGESPQDQADRLRHALFVLSGLDDINEMKRIARAAMAGESHGHEGPSLDEIEREAVKRFEATGRFGIEWPYLDEQERLYYRGGAAAALMNRPRESGYTQSAKCG